MTSNNLVPKIRARSEKGAKKVRMTDVDILKPKHAIVAHIHHDTHQEQALQPYRQPNRTDIRTRSSKMESKRDR